MARHYIHYMYMQVHSQRDRLSISVSAASSWQVNQPKQAIAIRAARSKVYSHDTKLLFSSDFTVICCCLQVHFIPIHIYTSIVYNSYMHVYTIYIYIEFYIEFYAGCAASSFGLIFFISIFWFCYLIIIFSSQEAIKNSLQFSCCCSVQATVYTVIQSYKYTYRKY